MINGQLVFSLQNKIIILVCGVVAIALLVTNVWVTRSVGNNVRQSLERKAVDISHIVAHSSEVINGLADGGDEQAIQNYAKATRVSTNVEFIVVFDMHGMRKSHPVAERVGLPIVGGDESRALRGEEYISLAQGTLGLSLRAFTPIFTPDGRQLGAVVVGILLGDVEKSINESRSIIYLATLFGLLAGLAGAVLLAHNIKKALFGLEPSAIAKLLEERSAMLQSVREGVLAVDKMGVITLANNEAKRILQIAGVAGEPVGQKVESYVPHTRMNEVLMSGRAEFDQEQNINGVNVLTNRRPLVVKGQIVGAIATFRDMTEIRQLAEELTGVNAYVEALRSQAHEFFNRMHVVLGLVRIKSYEKLDEYIAKVVNEDQEEMDFVANRIQDPILAGFILSKLSRARELGINLTLADDSFLPVPKEKEVVHGLVTIIGNLVDNAFEAVREVTSREVDVAVIHMDGYLNLTVKDNGPGIDKALQEHIFDKGFSTKATGRGVGLFLVALALEKLDGRIGVASDPQQGTVFTVTLPYEAGGAGFDQGTDRRG